VGGSCSGCSVELKVRETIYQLATGAYERNAITPHLTSVVAEWHTDCLQNSGLVPQMSPYQCSSCGGEVADGEIVVYMTRGEKPAVEHLRPERRGKALPFIAHESCLEGGMKGT
jgi:hypothetical protein